MNLPFEPKEFNSTGSEKILCFHCHLPIIGKVEFWVDFGKSHSLFPDPNFLQKTFADNSLKPLCCAGCQAISKTIIENNLTDYYRYREVNSIQGLPKEDLIPKALQEEILFYDHPEILKQLTINHNNTLETFLVIDNIVCAACVWLLERSIKEIKGVSFFQINYTTHRGHLNFDPTQVKLSEILIKIHKLGYTATPFDEHQQNKQIQKQRSSLLKYFAVATISSMQVMMLTIGLYFGDYEGMNEQTRLILRWANFILSIPCITYASWIFYRSAWFDLLNKRLSMDVNISIAIILGSLASIYNTITNTGHIYFESVTMFAFLLLGTRLIEMNARFKATNLMSHVLKIKPKFAHKMVDDQESEIISLSDIQMNDILLIKPGETIPTDGVLLTKEASIDESLLTGESLPIYKKEGDLIIGGAFNTDQSIKIKVTRIGSQTVYSQLTRLIDRATSDKPKIAQWIESISNYFFTLLIVITLISYLAWLYFDKDRAFEIVLAILAISCPCALALATPSALAAGAQSLIRTGILPTRSQAIDNLSNVTDIVFDKTGTLTNGKFTITHSLDPQGNPLNEQDRQIYLKIAKLLEQGSNHPIAKSFLNETVKEDHFLNLLNTTQLLGKGVIAQIKYQGIEDTYKLGALEWLKVPTESIKTLFAITQVSTWVALAKNNQLIAFFGLSDQLRPDTLNTLELLKNQKKSYTIHLVSGDQQKAVEKFANLLEQKGRFKFDQLRFAQSPEEKLAYVAHLQKQGKVVAMLGDGLNDAPVLAQADVSIAMNQGADLSQSTADMVMLTDQLSCLSRGFLIAKQTKKIIKQNLIWALIYNVIALPLAVFGLIVPWIAALGMSASSLIVIGNTLRLNINDKATIPKS